MLFFLALAFGVMQGSVIELLLREDNFLVSGHLVESNLFRLLGSWCHHEDMALTSASLYIHNFTVMFFDKTISQNVMKNDTSGDAYKVFTLDFNREVSVARNVVITLTNFA